MDGGGRSSAGSSEVDRIRGVAFSVPHVMSCLTAAGPSSEGVGDGIEGSSENPLSVDELGLSVKKTLLEQSSK